MLLCSALAWVLVTFYFSSTLSNEHVRGRLCRGGSRHRHTTTEGRESSNTGCGRPQSRCQSAAAKRHIPRLETHRCTKETSDVQLRQLVPCRHEHNDENRGPIDPVEQPDVQPLSRLVLHFGTRQPLIAQPFNGGVQCAAGRKALCHDKTAAVANRGILQFTARKLRKVVGQCCRAREFAEENVAMIGEAASAATMAARSCPIRLAWSGVAEVHVHIEVRCAMKLFPTIAAQHALIASNVAPFLPVVSVVHRVKRALFRKAGSRGEETNHVSEDASPGKPRGFAGAGAALGLCHGIPCKG